MERHYLEIARELGWKEGAVLEAQPQPEASTSNTTQEGTEDDIWDKDTDRSSGGRGLGVKVSTMSQDPEEETRESGSLHALVHDGDVAGVEKHLQEHPSTDLNQVDEHVRISKYILLRSVEA